MSKFVRVLLIISVSLIIGCQTKKNEVKSANSHLDTLSQKNKCLLLDDSCNKVFKTYFYSSGLAISNYYLVFDSLKIDINRDENSDKLLVLSPRSIEINEFRTCNCDSIPRRILVEVIDSLGVFKIKNIYNNLISAIPSVLSGYNGLFVENDGFSIEHEKGARYSWFYKMIFGYDVDGVLYVKKTIKICSFDGAGDTIVEYYNHFPAKNVNLNDTIENNCNCDNAWSKLEVDYDYEK